MKPPWLPGEPGEPTHPWRPGRPGVGQPLPPLPPGVEEDPGHPIVLPGEPGFPIEIPEEPGQPLPLPPGFVWPPFDPSEALSGKVLLLFWVPGVNKLKWIVIEVPEITLPTPPAGGWGKPTQPLPVPPEREPKR
jgi:hypothetical protein